MRSVSLSVIVCAMALVCVSVHAQGPMGGPAPMGMGGQGRFGGGAVDMSEIAKVQVDRLAGALELTGKQYDKIYHIYLNELDRRVNQMGVSGGGFPGGFPGGPGMGGPGGPGMGGGFPGMGRSSNAEGGMLGDGMSQAQRTYMRIISHEPTKQDIKAQQKIEKKMSKILTPVQFARWKEIESKPLPMPGMRGGSRNPQGGQHNQQGGQRGPQGNRGPGMR